MRTREQFVNAANTMVSAVDAKSADDVASTLRNFGFDVEVAPWRENDPTSPVDIRVWQIQSGADNQRERVGEPILFRVFPGRDQVPQANTGDAYLERRGG